MTEYNEILQSSDFRVMFLSRMKYMALGPLLNRGSVTDNTVFGIKIFICVVVHEASLFSCP